MHYSKRRPLHKLRKVRLGHNVTQQQIADKLGCTLQFYSQIERGINTLSYDYALRIALFFDMTPDELFKEEFEDLYKKRG